MSAAELWRRGQEGWPRRYPLAQFPNAPLLASFAGSGLAALTSGDAHDVGRSVAILGLGVWAWMELTDGVNAVRRLVGAGALVWVVTDLAGQL